MKKIWTFNSICAFLAVICISLMYLLDYLGGYQCFHLTVGLFPAALLPALPAFVLTGIVIVTTIVALIRWRDIGESFLFLCVVISFWILPIFILRARPFMLGLKHRILSLHSKEELKELAVEARGLLPEGGSICGPVRSFYKEQEDGSLWEQISKYEFLKLARSSGIIYVNSDVNEVEVYWGSGLVGSWGIRISEEKVEREEYDYDYLEIDDNIALYMTN